MIQNLKAASIILILYGLSLNSISGQCFLEVEAMGDTTICAGDGQAQLHGEILSGDAFDYYWEPAFLVDDPNSLDPIATVSTPSTLYFTARCLGTNTIVNGDFESGNTGFTSEYVYSPGDLWSEGTYDILTNPNFSHPNFAPCSDHTSGAGQMMVINGETTPNEEVWCQTVTVDPGIDYVFQTWITTVVSSNPAQLQFSINGQLIGNIFNAPSTNCLWQQFDAVWNSGASVSAEICIVNQNTIASGNDFALDDIFFGPLEPFTDSVIIEIAPPTESWVDTTICPGFALIIGGNSYSQPGSYDVLLPGGNANGCDSTIHLSVEHYAFDILLGGNDFIDCFNPVTSIIAEVTPFDPDLQFTWTTDVGNIVDGQGTPVITVDAEGTYTLEVTFDDGFMSCSFGPEEIFIDDRSMTPFVQVLDTPTITCEGLPGQILAFTPSTNYTASWTTLTGNIVTGANTLEPWIDATGEYNLFFLDLDNGCDTSISVFVPVDDDLPTAIASGDTVLNCNVAEVFLDGSASFPVPLEYAWYHQESGNTLISTEALFSTDVAGTYTLVVTNPANQCIHADSITIIEDRNPPDLTLPGNLKISCETALPGFSTNVLPDQNDVSINWISALQPQQQNDSLLFPEPGQYIVETVDLENQCVILDTVVVSIDTMAPEISLPDSVNIDCTNPIQQIHLEIQNPENDLRIFWQDSQGNFLGMEDSLIVSQANIYTVLVLDETNGCTSSATTMVRDYRKNPALSLAKSNDLDCKNPAADISAFTPDSSQLSYNWQIHPGIMHIFPGGDRVRINQPGQYSLTITDTSTGCTNVDSISVSQDLTTPDILLDSFALVTCANPTLDLQAQVISSNPYYVNWQTADGLYLTNTESIPVTIQGPGTYHLIIEDTITGCRRADSIVVGTNEMLPHVDAGRDSMLNCLISEIQLNGGSSETGSGFIHWWTTMDGNIVTGDSTLFPLVNKNGRYTLHTLNLQNGCEHQQSVLIDIDTLSPTVLKESVAMLNCKTDSVSLTVQVDLSFDLSWSTSDGVLSGDLLSPMVWASREGTYTLEVSNPLNGCSNAFLFEVFGDYQAPVGLPASPDTINCEELEVELSFLQLPNRPHVFTWTDPRGNILGNEHTTFIQAQTPGEYAVDIVFEDNGCLSSFTFLVPIDTTAPIADAGVDQILSCAFIATLDGSQSSMGNHYQYNWTGPSQANITTPAAISTEVDQSGEYLLEVVDLKNGCRASDKMMVSDPIPLTFEMHFADPTCANPVGQLTLGDVTGGNAPYSITILETGDSYNPGNLPGLPSGTYSINLEDKDGCESTVAIHIPDTMGISVQIPDFLELEPGEQYLFVPQLSIPPNEISIVDWTPDDHLDCSDCLQPLLTASANEQITLSIESAEGCKASDIVTIQLVVDPKVYIPNAFSPNGDLINDVFRIFADASIVEIQTMQIYNRWGGRVFQVERVGREDDRAHWDGTMNGKELKPGVFVYHITVVDILGGTHFFKGDVHLMR